MATVTKRNIVSRLSDKLDITQQQALDLVEAFLETVEQAVSSGDEVTFRTFGTFALREAKGKIGRNPAEPEVAVEIPARCVLRFKPSKELKDRVAALPLETVRKIRKPRGRNQSGQDGLDGNHS